MKASLIIICLILLTSCEEVVYRKVTPAAESVIVVEGLLTNERTRHVVRVSKSSKGQDGVSQPVSGAFVRIIEGPTVYPLTESTTRPGEYLTFDMRAVFGKVYTLHIQHEGKDYIASDSSIPVEPLTPISYRGVTGGFAINFAESGQDPNFVRHEINWKSTASCVGGSCEGLVIFYDLKTVDVNEVTKPGKELFIFPAGATIVRKKYSVSPAYRAFLRGALSETEWRGSFFDVDHANAPTNLSGGALGFFAVTTVAMDSTVVK